MSEELSQLKTLKNTFLKAYLQLLHQYSPNQISVKQIVSIANTSRSSFYTHFDNREQLHAYVKEQIHREFFQHYASNTSAQLGSMTTFTLCQHIIQYRSYYQHAFQDTSEFQHMANRLSNYLMQVYNDRDYAIFASFGTIGYLKHWAEEGFIVSPSEASEKLLKIGFTNWSSRVGF